MPSTNIYNLGASARGSEYSATTDYQRFVTVDYNLQSYIGVCGVGIIQGWVIQPLDGLNAQITPGNGIIDGYFGESAYVVKTRKEMVTGDREIELWDDTSIPAPYLTTTQKNNYVSIVQAYNPEYIAPSQIENYKVKVAVSYQISFSDNSNTYVFVELNNSDAYYPSKIGISPDVYPPLNTLIEKPDPNNFTTYSEYLVEYANYQSQMSIVNNYEWTDNLDNHFTEVSFVKSSSSSVSTNRVLIAKVVTRNGSITKVDVTGVKSLYKMYSVIKSYYDLICNQHQHGGNKVFDPPKINLKTDIRKASLMSMYTNKSTNSKYGTYKVLEREPTSIVNGHKHAYYVDANGNGLTVDVIGSGGKHFHKISNFVVATQEYTDIAITSHTHTVSTIYDDSWTSANQFEIFLNGSAIGDQSNVVSNPSEKTITVQSLIGGIYKTYSVEFPIFDSTYSFSSQENDVFSFMINMMLDFQNKFGSAIIDSGNIGNSPFIFSTQSSNGNQELNGYNDVISQSIIAETFLQEEGDYFIFTPNAAQNIKVTLSSYKKIKNVGVNSVIIEILGNSEVTGVLKEENILFINADKINSGIISIARVPFISHVGRINEKCNAVSYKMVSTDGLKYNVVPDKTELSLGHSHDLTYQYLGSGLTNNALVNNDPSQYAYTDSGNSYYINHVHSFYGDVTGIATSDGLAAWQGQTSSLHTHGLIKPITGNSHVVYSMIQDSNGNIFSGTSDGLYMIPKDEAFTFVINGYTYNTTASTADQNGTSSSSSSIDSSSSSSSSLGVFHDSDEFTTPVGIAFIKAKNQYEKDTGYFLNIDSNIYSPQLKYANEYLTEEGNSLMMYGVTRPDRTQDKIMIKMVYSFELPNYFHTTTKDIALISSSDQVMSIQVMDKNTGEVIYDASEPNPEELSSILSSSPDNVKIVAVVKQKINDIPVWMLGMSTYYENGQDYEKIIAIGSNVMASNFNLNINLYTDWIATLGLQDSIFKRFYVDSNNDMYVATNNGLVVGRDINHKQSFSYLSQGGINISASDVIGNGSIIYSSANNIYSSADRGKTWTLICENQFDIVRLAKDTVTSIIYFIDTNNDIYSYDGALWTQITTAPYGEISDIVIINGAICVGMQNGLYEYSGVKWDNILGKTVYSLSISYDQQYLLIGCDDAIYEYDGSSVGVLHSFNGNYLSYISVNSSKKMFGYAYSNKNTSFYFKDCFITNEEVLCLVEFDRWKTTQGAWNSASTYDLFMDGIMIKSTKYNIDNSAEIVGNFTINPEAGTIDFGANAEISSDLSINASYATVLSASSFMVGDSIFIKSTKSYGTPPINPGLPTSAQTTEEAKKTADAFIKYINELNAYQDNKNSIDNMYYFTTISNINGNLIYFSSNCEKYITTPASMYKIAAMGANTDFVLNIYDSKIKNIGTLSHDELDDKVSNEYDFKPLSINNTFTENLLSFIQYLNSQSLPVTNYLKNINLFNFSNVSQIDTENSQIYNKGIFKGNYTNMESSKINDILVGHGLFADRMFVGTDIGLFWSKITYGVEANLFYVYDIPCSVNKIEVVDYLNSDSEWENKLIAFTDKGSYFTLDMKTWTFQSGEEIQFPLYCAGRRWSDGSYVSVSSHTCNMYNVLENNQSVGVIHSSSNLYGKISDNRSLSVNVDGDTLRTGMYMVKSATESTIVLETPFDFSDGHSSVFTNVTLKQAAWWNQFSGGISQIKDTIYNPIIAGGKDRISYCFDFDKMVWQGASVPVGLSDFNVSSVCPLSCGSMLSSFNGYSTNNIFNNIMTCSNMGSSWDSIKEFPSYSFAINDFYLSPFGHTVLSINFSPIFGNGYFNGKKISINDKNGNLIYDGYSVDNDHILSKTITVFSGEACSAMSKQPLETYTITVYPSIVNVIAETSDSKVLFGTNDGLYNDSDTISLGKMVNGSVYGIGVNGTIQTIDLNGTINSVTANDKNGNMVLVCYFSDNVNKNDLSGKKAYVGGNSFNIVSNDAKNTSSEVRIEVSALYVNYLTLFVSKQNIVVAGVNSYIIFNANRELVNNELKGGKIYVLDSSGVSYEDTIVSNISNKIFITSNLQDTKNGNFAVGKTIYAVNENNQWEFTVAFNRMVSENEFVGFVFSPYNVSGSDTLVGKIIVASNSGNIIVTNSAVKFDQIKNINIFDLHGVSFNRLREFDNKYTTIDEDHYHDTNMVGRLVYGDIGSFSNINSSSLTINVTNTNGFLDPVVQYKGTLFQDGNIRFKNNNNIAIEYYAKIISHDATSITISTDSIGVFDTSGYNVSKVSVGWSWDIDATNYGYTLSTIYKDFDVLNLFLVNDASYGTNILYVTSTASIVAGDKISIQTTNNIYEENYVFSVISPTEIQLEEPIKHNLYNKYSASIKVIRDVFSNIHEHQIRSSMVENMPIYDYQNLGYNLSHSHRLIPYIENISSIVVSGGKITVSGNNSKIYRSENNGGTWSKLVDIVDYADTREDINLISLMYNYNNKLFIGSNGGNIFVKKEKNNNVIPIENPSPIG